MCRYFLLLFLLIPFRIVAGTESYSCVIKQVFTIGDQSLLENAEGDALGKRVVGKKFTIDRNTGKMKGTPFNTDADGYDSIAVLDKGTNSLETGLRAYKAILVSHADVPHVMYVYVTEYLPQKKKTFILATGPWIYGGFCE